MNKLKGIVYLNQFFGQIGGEDKADFEPKLVEGCVGPAMEYNKQLGEGTEITHTVICGDNFMGSNTDEGIKRILEFLETIEFDIFFAGPAFRAGRYGAACGHIAKAVKEKFGVPVITSMNDENPGVEMFRKEMYIFKGGASAGAMRKDIKKITRFANKITSGDVLLPADEEGYFGRGIRHQVWLNPPVKAADRSVDMILAKIHNKKFETELKIPKDEKVSHATPIKNLLESRIALITTGGIVPSDNPDRIQSASATRWGKYDMSGLETLKPVTYKTIHAGFDPAVANANPNVIVPLDVMRIYENEGKIKKLHEYFYSTVGTGTTQGEAARMGQEIVKELINDGVDGVIMTST